MCCLGGDLRVNRVYKRGKVQNEIEWFILSAIKQAQKVYNDQINGRLNKCEFWWLLQ
jgi:hypothetical protein